MSGLYDRAMNEFEMNVEIVNRIRDTMLEYYEDTIDENVLEAYGDIAETIVEALGLTIVSVDPTGVVDAQLDLSIYA